MAYQVIARKWRPQKFEDVTGQEVLTRTLRNSIEHGRLHHAYLFSGARGVGKTITARLETFGRSILSLIWRGPTARCEDGEMRTETKAFIAVCLAALTLSFLSLTTLAQAPGWVSDPNNRTEIYDPWKKTDQQWYRALQRPRSEDRVVKKGLLAPSAQDRTDYTTFLKGSNTGLIRLLADPRAHASLIRGGGSYYSFHYLSHEYGSGTDIQLQRPMVFIFGSAPQKWLDRIHDSLAVGFAGANYGMMTNLGNVPLDEIDAKDPRARFLATYEPPRFESDARCQAHRFVGGEMIDGRLYKKSLPVQVGGTYLLRSINYSESDVLVAFRVARQDDDGSVIIAWKLLNDFRPRKLENINVKGTCN